MRSRFVARGLVLAASVALAACAGSRDATEKDMAELRATIAKLRSEQATLAERLDAVEGTRRRASPASASGDRPDLDVVKLEPDPSEAADADGARPVIRAQGRNGSVEDASREKPQGPERDYELAMELYKQKKTDKALAAFGTYLGRYPEHPNAESVTFFRAEGYAGKGDHRRAIEQYEAVVTRWPAGARAPEALLRAAQSYTRLGDKNGSDEAKKRLAAAYPQSDAAKKLALVAKPK